MFLSAKGRIGRQDFWIAWFLVIMLSVCLSGFGLVGQVLIVLLAYPQICLFAKRLHDLGRSGWFTLLPFGLSLAATLVISVGGALAPAPEGVMYALAMVVLVIAIANLVITLRIGLARGQAEANAYGPPRPRFLALFGRAKPV